MLVYTHKLTERSKYIFNLIFGELLGLEYAFTTDLAAYESYEQEKLAYTMHQPASGFFVESVSLLFETGITAIQPSVFSFAGTCAFFQTHGGRFSFDLFAASFYLVSRYEEYLPFEPDQYGRFPAKQSLAYQHGFLQTPVVNCWVQEFKKMLLQFYPFLRFRDVPFQSTISFDIDVAYAYKGRPAWWNAGALLKDIVLLRTQFLDRVQVLSGRKDPYDTYDDIETMLACYQVKPLFFFLLADMPSRYDRNLAARSASLHRLIRRCSATGSIGIHPSYYSMEKPSLLGQEKEQLEKSSGQPITRSRQHYLRFRLPHTYVQLAGAGITDEYSMGYAELPGFRAGICTPFYFFNLAANQATTLKVHPVTYMDGSFIEDLQMHPGESLEMIKQMINTVKQVQGHFLCIWHNHTVSETGPYKGWKQVLQETLRLLYKS